MASPEVAIIGGGIIGCALVYELSRHGVAVALFERGTLAREASWASAGIISPPAPGQGARTELALLGWRRYPELVRELEDETSISTGWNRSGELVLGLDDEAALRELGDWQRARGMDVELVDGAQLRDIEPALHPRFQWAVYNRDVATVVLERVALAMARVAQRRGAVVYEHHEVRGIDIEGGRAVRLIGPDGEVPVGGVVVAAGAWSGWFGGFLGLSIPTVPVRGQMFAVKNPPLPIRTVISGEDHYIIPRADGTVAVGATVEPGAGFDKRVTPAGIANLHAVVDRLAPAVNHGELVTTWAGLRPATIDGSPIIGPVPGLDNVWVATGHYRTGALLAPATAELLTPVILGGGLDQRLQPFDPGRFA
jgi:glycine oxidase